MEPRDSNKTSFNKDFQKQNPLPELQELQINQRTQNIISQELKQDRDITQEPQKVKTIIQTWAS